MAQRRLTLMKVNRNADLPLLEFERRSFEQDVLQALDPLNSVTRYRRTWRLSRPRSSPDHPFISAKLGFEGAARTDSDVVYDEDLEDFIASPTTRGSAQFSHFIIDTEHQYLLFEEKPPDIRTTSFVGALRTILQQDATAHRFDLDPVPDLDDFNSWLRRTTRVTKFRVTVRPPNPHWLDRPRAIRDFVEESNAAHVTIDATASEDGPGLEIPNSDLGAFSEHAGLGYGTISGTGETAEGRTRYHSNRSTRGAVIDADPDESEPSFLRTLFETLRSLIPQ